LSSHGSISWTKPFKSNTLVAVAFIKLLADEDVEGLAHLPDEFEVDVVHQSGVPKTCGCSANSRRANMSITSADILAALPATVSFLDLLRS
jgi:hypothetical protein